jgi:hypothetical protein
LSWVIVKRTPIFRAEVTAQANATQRSVESARHLPKMVVGCTDAVERNADVVEIALGDAIDVRVDQGAVRRQADVEAHRLGTAGDVEDVRMQQRLAAGENQHRHAKTLEIVHHRKDLVGRQLTGKVPSVEIE